MNSELKTILMFKMIIVLITDISLGHENKEIVLISSLDLIIPR